MGYLIAAAVVLVVVVLGHRLALTVWRRRRDLRPRDWAILIVTWQTGLLIAIALYSASVLLLRLLPRDPFWPAPVVGALLGGAVSLQLWTRQIARSVRQ